MKIYTKTGDKGTTSLLGGTRVSKFDDRVEIVGLLDEINASIGVAISFMNGKKYKEISEELYKIQNHLFNIGAEIAYDKISGVKENKTLQLQESYVIFLENLIDKYDKVLPPLTQFILPGGSKSSSFIHLSRTIIRRTERKIVFFSKTKEINSNILKYINRLSDLFFILSRYTNFLSDKKDIMWKKDIKI